MASTGLPVATSKLLHLMVLSVVSMAKIPGSTKPTGSVLCLSRQIMRLHGGSISVQSRPGYTCFELVV